MESHLLQMRGLKHYAINVYHTETGSHLLQMRGLKQITTDEPIYQNRRIFYRCVD